MGPAECSVLHTTELNTSSLQYIFNQSNILINATCISDTVLLHASSKFSLPQMKVWTVAKIPFEQQLKPWHISPTKTCCKHFCLFALPHASINFFYKVQKNIAIYWLFLILKFAITELISAGFSELQHKINSFQCFWSKKVRLFLVSFLVNFFSFYSNLYELWKLALQNANSKRLIYQCSAVCSSWAGRTTENTFHYYRCFSTVTAKLLN